MLVDSVVAPCNEKTDFTGAGSVAYCVELEKYLSFLSGEKSVQRIERQGEFGKAGALRRIVCDMFSSIAKRAKRLDWRVVYGLAVAESR